MNNKNKALIIGLFILITTGIVIFIFHSKINNKTIKFIRPLSKGGLSAVGIYSSKLAQTYSSINTTENPSGMFVSNHNPSFSGAPYPSIEESTCFVEPGSTCYIEFSQKDLVIKLPPQETNSYGETSWVWDIKDSGLKIGEWKIAAISKKGNNYNRTSDTRMLEVSK